jgi:hypothetical protein
MLVLLFKETRVSTMKKLNHKSSGIFLILSVTFFMIGCASEPVKVDLPDNHPANPQSQETAFIPPPNPFKNNIPMAGHEADSSSSMTHEKHPTSHQHKMIPQTDKTGHDSHSSHASETQNPEHQHEEHNQ